jgi:hypothetical protein
MADTANFGWTKPTVGGSQDAWGTILNTALDDIDTDLQTVDNLADTGISDAAAAQATADAALPKAGGIMTGRQESLTGSAKFVENLTATGAVALDVALANVFKLNLTGNITALTFSNVPTITGDYMQVILIDIDDNGFTISWPASVTEWAGGSAPTLNGRDVVMLISFDDGTSWQGSVVQKNLS